MATIWSPRPTYSAPRSWLLGNGEVVTEPALEESPSGQKVRIAGTDISAYSRDLNTLILSGVDAIAKKKRTNVWMPLADYQARLEKTLGYEPGVTKATLYALEKDLDRKTIAWWRFKHPTLPIEAYLTVRAHREGAYEGSAHIVAASVTYPRPDPHKGLSATLNTEVSGTFQVATSQVAGDDYVRAREFIRDNPPNWNAGAILGSLRFGAERDMVKAVLAKVRACDDLETIQVPDMRNLAKPGWLDLELYETNVNAQFLSDLTEYLEGTPTVTEALRLYDELRECLRGIGWVMKDKTENDFQKALLSGDPSGVTVDLGNTHAPGGVDPNHTLSLHMPTGTFVVSCSLDVHGQNEVAEKWEEALAIASLTGEEDTLLAYAREYVRRGQQKAKRAVIAERKGQIHP